MQGIIAVIFNFSVLSRQALLKGNDHNLLIMK